MLPVCCLCSPLRLALGAPDIPAMRCLQENADLRSQVAELSIATTARSQEVQVVRPKPPLLAGPLGWIAYGDSPIFATYWRGSLTVCAERVKSAPNATFTLQGVVETFGNRLDPECNAVSIMSSCATRLPLCAIVRACCFAGLW